MAIRVIVFDFDGTLIDSNPLKYNAYFELFLKDEWHAKTIRQVLSEIFEASRYVILEEILRRLGGKAATDVKQKVSELADQYNDIVLVGAKTCPEKPGAEKILKTLVREYKLYISSTTPDAALKEIIRFRKWDGYFEDIFGYPHEKSKTLKHIMEREAVKGPDLLVVGDGESDRKSALDNSCLFIHVAEGFHLEELVRLIENS
jgi:phosphoglycolate phosphatase-like HAD superfamily hydrolase